MSDQTLYLIGMAARLAGMHPQTLRVYERRGLICPARSAGQTRRYSAEDIALLRRIQELSDEGLNLAGIERVLALEGRLARLRAAEQRLEYIRALEVRLEETERQVRTLTAALSRERAARRAAQEPRQVQIVVRTSGALVPLHREEDQ